MIRDVLLGIFGLVWGAVAVVTVVRTGEWPPAEGWAAFGLGIGAVLAAFRTDESVSRRRRRTSGGDDE